MSRIAAIQMCSSHLVEDNLNTAKRFIEMAAENKAKLIVLPEMFAIIGLKPGDAVAAKETYGSGIIQSFLSEQAKAHNCWILGGTIPISCQDQSKVRAASLLYNHKGEVAARYDKIHLFDVVLSPDESYKESNHIEPGNELIVVDTPVGKLGLGVCYDIRFPEMFRYLFNQGAEIIALPSAFTVKTGSAHWEVLSRSRAIENFAYFIGAAQGGTHTGGRKTFGHSLIVEPWGSIVAKIDGTEPGVIYTDINLEKLNEIRQSIPVSEHQKIVFDITNLR
jgi:nitrilase